METKQRHGCLTTWLVFIIIVNTIGTFVYLVSSDIMNQMFPDTPSMFISLLIILGIINVVCAVALLKWKKWGFHGFIATSITSLIVNLLIGLSIVQSLFGLLGVAVLYGVLNIGKDRAAWSQLE